MAGGRGPGGNIIGGKELSDNLPWTEGGGGPLLPQSMAPGGSMVGADRRVKIRLCPSSWISVG